MSQKKFRLMVRASSVALVALAATLMMGTAWANDKTAGVPVEPDMHEFMEYYFQPTYKRLKPVMEKEPADKAGWKEIKSASVILAEGGNLLLNHVPDKDAEDWVKHATDVRTAGTEFYRAAQAKDFATARAKYEQMLSNCNACHMQFENGKHILKP